VSVTILLGEEPVSVTMRTRCDSAVANTTRCLFHRRDDAIIDDPTMTQQPDLHLKFSSRNTSAI
jgi:hypothetical protein